MADYTELVKALRHCAKQGLCNGCPRCGKRIKNCSAELKREAADAIEELDTLLDGVSADNDALCETIERLKKPRWIPVTERLPVDCKNVLAAFDDVVLVAFYGNNEWTETATYSLFFPTHWMPLPTPPEEETE